jgi:DNA-binding response OmpR family regulator
MQLPQTVLLIDDDRLFLKEAQRFLELNGFQVSIATSWLDFTTAFYANPTAPDIVFFDINLGSTVPGDRLLYVFKEGRKSLPSAQKTKLALLSGLPERELQDRARLCGADGYIKKEGFAGPSGRAFLQKLQLLLKAH